MWEHSRNCRRVYWRSNCNDTTRQFFCYSKSVNSFFLSRSAPSSCQAAKFINSFTWKIYTMNYILIINLQSMTATDKIFRWHKIKFSPAAFFFSIFGTFCFAITSYPHICRHRNEGKWWRKEKNSWVDRSRDGSGGPSPLSSSPPRLNT